jgi:DNA-binding FadR family transcriptional regulator
MKNIVDEKELVILKMIRDSEEPIGSWAIADKLAEMGISVSSATAGRMLNRLEKLGFLEKKKFKGRVITKKGQEAIANIKKIQKIDFHRNELMKFINSQVLEEYLMVLEARKAIEGATARLAAKNITVEEIKRLEEILKEQERNYSLHRSITNNDLDFHKTIARASGNRVLENLYHIISMSGQQSEIFEFIRETVGAPYMVSHKRIYEALKKGDAVEAEKCMILHIENLVSDVKKYWEQYQRKKT